MASGNKRLKIARFESVAARDPENREALTQLGLLHESLEEYDKAIDFFERCLRVDNKDPDVLASTAYCYLRTEDLAKALATYQRALFLLDNKATPKILYGLGVLYDRNEKFEVAKSTFEQLVAAFVDFEAGPEVQLRLGGVCKLLGQYDEGLKWFQAALDSDTCPPPFTPEDIWFEIAQLHCLKADFARAEEAYEYSGRGGGSQESEQWCALGRNYSAIQEYRQAFNAYNEAISLDPQSWAMWRCMGDLYSKLNQQNDALDAYQRVTELNPAAAEVWYDMGVILEASKRFPQAINAFERVLDIEPTNGDVRARLERLRGIAPKRPKREAAVMGARLQSRHTKAGAPPPNSLHQAVADGNVARLRVRRLFCSCCCRVRVY
jgi:tetratricopeptide (TPR) repeat protein